MVERIRRSFLYTPADNPHMMEKAATTGADAIVFDLEDAVRAEDKADARETLQTMLATVDYGETELCVRVNDLSTSHWRADLEAAVAAGVHTVSLPLVERSDQVTTVVSELRELTETPPQLTVLLETPAGVFAGREIAEVCATFPEVTALGFGMGDYARATGGEPTSPRIREFLSHRIVGFAAIGNLQPIASVYPDVSDLDALRRVAEEAVEIGFGGQSVIHPTQVPIVNDVYTPETETVAMAQELVTAYERADRGALVYNGVFLDEALVERYRRLLSRAAAITEAERHG